ncbi:hypothetical protein FOA43_003645 [Brettanomyces nanus]|uniref:Lysophospholipase NTE1 n=1 Tax=Eeniella nana TaxID=13502 RepID=A0A875S9D6_EENNA|nr:uncharacterized protein FOA43_003645 [Brettanomyces nanus]QPG76259.1 hypothetical protein FOA43_003645 [Brettanomyces nanus]
MSSSETIGHEIITQASRMDLIASEIGSEELRYSSGNSFITNVVGAISWLIYKLLSHTLFYVPSVIYLILSHTVQVNLSFTSLLIFSSLIVLIAYSYVRYRYLTKYSRLPEEPKRQEPTIDTFLEPSNEDGKSRVSYLDEFLSAIKIFGYLEKSVFHELTKSMQTQKLDSGEILFLDDSSGFTICVEGEIQVYFKIGEERDRKQALFAKDSSKDVVIVDGIRYQLLNIIKSGAPVSSFISILNLLTNPSAALPYAAPTPSVLVPGSAHHSLPLPHDGFALDGPFDGVSSPNYLGKLSTDMSGKLPAANSLSFSPTSLNAHSASPNLPSLNSYPTESNAGGVPCATDSTSQSSSAMELIAIPKGNCTISIIPRESFSRLAHKYPKATTHIIEMILTKLYRVTFQTASDYLDLTSDIFQTEINLNKYAKNKISRYLCDNAIKSLDRRADVEAATLNSSSNESETSENGLHDSSLRSPITVMSSRHFQNSNYDATISTSPAVSSAAKRRQRHFRRSIRHGNQSSDILAYDSADESTNSLNEDPRSSSVSCVRSGSARNLSLKSRNKSNTGDLMSKVPLPRSGSDINVGTGNSDMHALRDRTFSGNDEGSEDFILMSSLADAICSIIGIEKGLFISTDTPLTSSVSSSRNGVQMISSLAAVNVVPVVEEHPGSKLRTFSTSGIQISSSNDDEPEGSTPESGEADYLNVKKDLADEIQILRISQGTRIIKSEEQTPGIYYVIDGALDVTYWKRQMEELDGHSVDLKDRRDSLKEKLHEEFLYTVRKNQIAGYLGTVIGSKSFIDVRAATTTYAAFIPRNVFDFMIERYPRVEACIARHLLTVLDRRLYLTDYAIEWVHSSAGASLYLQGDPANGIYIVLNGRFRSVKLDRITGKHEVLSEHGQGVSLGEVEVLTNTKRLVTLIAIRDSELARIPRTLFEMIALSNPSIMVNVSRIVASRVTRAITTSVNTIPIGASATSPHIKDEPLLNNFTDFRTLTVLPVTQGLPVMEFGERLGLALEATGKSVKMLNQSSALTSLGKHAFDRLAKLKQSGYFAELEEKYDIIVYLVDTIANSSWTRTCIQQGDCILLLADAMASSDIGEYERLLVKTKTTARTELVLLHPERSMEPGLTNRWLKNRIWVHSHHHIQMQLNLARSDAQNVAHQEDDISRMEKIPELFRKSTAKIRDNLKTKVESIITGNDLLIRLARDSFKSKKYYQPMQTHKNDFMRLARILTGQSIGLVLGGGGARGLSHVGIIKALEDNGIPVDMIGGTSIGAFVGGLYAKDYDFVPVYGRAKTFAGRMATLWRSVLDLTIPVTSYITGHEFNRGIWKAFGDSRIEDFWIKYYTNSTNITESLMEVHTSGYAWRYIRASMSLASLLPPLTDNGNMLLDGGYIDNLTVGEMKRRGARTVIACDVGSADDHTPMNYGDSLSGFWVVLNRFNPFSRHPNVPTMADIQMRLAYVASVNALDRAKNTEGCLYLRPPIEDYATLDFGKFDEIYRVGAKYGSKIVKELRDNGELPMLKARKREVWGTHPLRRRYSI